MQLYVFSVSPLGSCAVYLCGLLVRGGGVAQAGLPRGNRKAAWVRPAPALRQHSATQLSSCGLDVVDVPRAQAAANLSVVKHRYPGEILVPRQRSWEGQMSSHQGSGSDIAVPGDPDHNKSSNP